MSIAGLFIEYFEAGMLALEFDDDALHLGNDCHVVAGVSLLDEIIDFPTDVVVVIFSDFCDLDFGVESGESDFGVVEDFFVKFLAFTESCIFDFDAFGTAQFYHSFGEIGDAHRFSHVENIYLTTIAHSTCFDDEFASFRNKHEEAYDVGMGYGDRAAVFQLLLE